MSEGLLYLQKDLGIYVVGLLDTNEAEKIIRKNVKPTSLACMLRKYFHDCLDSTYRDVEWSIRPLPKHMITYAHTETHYLLRIYDLQKAELLSRGSGEHLYQAFENSKLICLSVRNANYLHMQSRLKPDVIITQMFFIFSATRNPTGTIGFRSTKHN